MPKKGHRRQHPVLRVLAKRAVETAVDQEAKRAEQSTHGCDFPITSSIMALPFDEYLDVLREQQAVA